MVTIGYRYFCEEEEEEGGWGGGEREENKNKKIRKEGTILSAKLFKSSTTSTSDINFPET